MLAQVFEITSFLFKFFDYKDSKCLVLHIKTVKMSSDSEISDVENGEIISAKIREAAKNISMNLLPERSRKLYTAAYNAFKKWRRENGSNSFSEIVLLAYFDHLSKNYAPPSLWSTYSMLKTTINTYDQVDISNYKKLLSFLKKFSSGYASKKSAVFTKEHISTFLNQAPDEIYLSTKVSLIFGIAGALRRQELTDLSIKDITVTDDLLLVSIKKTKNKVPRSFTITGVLYDICQKYMQARPPSCSTDRFFLKYLNEKCIQQPIGINMFGAMPKNIACFLNLPDADKFTGHSFRRTSATLLVDAGADITALKRHGGWKSNSVAEGYIADSLNNKKRVCEQISSGIVLKKIAKNSTNALDVENNAIVQMPTSSPLVEIQRVQPLVEKPLKQQMSTSYSLDESQQSQLLKRKSSEQPHTSDSPFIKKSTVYPIDERQHEQLLKRKSSEQPQASYSHIVNKKSVLVAPQ